MDIIITGASRGIGRELVKHFCQTSACRILACARSGEKLAELQKYASEKAIVIPMAVDLGTETGIQAISEKAGNMGFQLKLLINNAGVLVNKPLSKLSSTDFDLVFNINVKSVFLLVQTLLPHFAKEAHIVNIGSMGGYQGSAKFPGLSLYSAAKGALAVFTECLAEELKEKEIKANCLALGAAQTEMLAEAFPGVKAPVSASEMAGFIADFALNGSSFFNGKVLPVSVSTP